MFYSIQKKLKHPLILIAAVSAVSCTNMGEPCTTEALENGLNVKFESATSSTFSVKIEYGSETLEFDCPKGSNNVRCTNDGFFVQDLIEDKLTMTITSEGNSLTKTINPEYKPDESKPEACRGNNRQSQVVFSQ